ncbi:hypothetical protein GUA87_03930 [Sneathiella sp. P13V-1]|uniref:hypothetical protein n=1 Tax=Sneathiella sp. P13V-1 TaxID=2697366 RepID=UPI00187B9091|nr:hypothetical protein [Sneathiella sp. P13V-1]MBE7635979.1 hypothetical protein [Sneathiella sp. P13V-1]
MKTVIRVSVLIAIAGGLVACQTSNKNLKGQEPGIIFGEKNLGRFVGYSEMCAQFTGNRIDNKIINHFRTKYSNSSEFEAGYRHFINYTQYDWATPPECGYVNGSLKLTYAKKEALSQKSYPTKAPKFVLKDTPHLLTVTWVDKETKTTHSFNLSQQGKEGQTEEFIVDDNRQCRVVFQFKRGNRGIWDMTCKDGEGGAGSFLFNADHNLTTGSGKTTFAGSIAFKMVRAT